jgi:hypothetical protein
MDRRPRSVTSGIRGQLGERRWWAMMKNEENEKLEIFVVSQRVGKLEMR